MDRNEAKIILLSLDGIQASIETLRSLVETLTYEEEEEPEETTIYDFGCPHNNIKEIHTHGSNTSLCADCGVTL